MLIFGNPSPMPDETNDTVGGIFHGEVIEISPGDKFICCEFENCRFHGVGPVEFNNCKITACNESLRALDHSHYISCDFMGIDH